MPIQGKAYNNMCHVVYFMRYLLVAMLQAISLLSFSQKPNLKFEHISTEAGLSQNYVQCILQDRQGFMWFGTDAGLNKYDGYKFTVYLNDENDRKGTSNTSIRGIAEDSQGNIWIATMGDGLHMLNRQTDKIIDFDLDGKNDQLHAVIVDAGGNIWLGTDNAGLCHFDKKSKKFTYYAHTNDPKSISDNYIGNLFEDSDHNLWVSTRDGLNLMDRKSGTFTSFKYDEKNEKSIGHKDSGVIFEDSKKRLWIGGPGGGLSLMNKANGEFKRYRHEIDRNSLSHNYVIAIYEDAKGYLWIGMQNGGVDLLDTENEIFYNYQYEAGNSNSINDNSIYSISRDTQGNMWIGTYAHGINFVNGDGNKFNHYIANLMNTGLSNNSVLSFVEDSKENLWISTDGGGINLFDRKNQKFTHYKHEDGNKNSIGGNYVLKIIEDANGNLWMGMWADGLTVFNREKNTYRHYKNDPNNPYSLGSNNIITIFEDSKKNIWIGGYTGGLNLYNPKEDNFIHYTAFGDNPTALSGVGINSINEDSKGNLWIGCEGLGLCVLNKETKSFDSFLGDYSANSISNNSILCIFEDSAKKLWIGTRGGLNRFDTEDKKFTPFHKKDGLPGEQISGILEDTHGNLWLSTNNGLSKFNSRSKNFKNFTIADGLQSNEFARNAFYKSRNGAMYFGGPNGFNEFFPDSIKEKAYDPPLVLTDFQLFNKPVAILGDDNGKYFLKKHINETKEITLSYKESVISFEFASLNYTIKDKKKYSYLMEGFDNDWNNIGNQHSATYTNLDAGHYTFKVRGLDNQGNWSNNILSLSLTITPPYWQTWWFRTLSGLFVMGTILSYYIIRINSINRQKRELERQVQERTNQLSLQAEHLSIAYTEIKSSIQAALEIQNSILPSENFIKKYFPDSFIFYKPKDVVSGDFYWFDIQGDCIIIAVVDCIGHGVSGALMTITGHHLLNKAVARSGSLIASEILNRLNEDIISELHQNAPNLQFGMDVSLCVFNRSKSKLQFAGANQLLYIIRDAFLIQIKSDKFSVGPDLKGRVHNFSNNDIDLMKGDNVYLFTDGFADQFGGEDGSKFLYSKFRDMLLDSRSETMENQKLVIEKQLSTWKGNIDQVDDILVIGLKI